MEPNEVMFTQYPGYIAYFSWIVIIILGFNEQEMKLINLRCHRLGCIFCHFGAEQILIAYLELDMTEVRGSGE